MNEQAVCHSPGEEGREDRRIRDMVAKRNLSDMVIALWFCPSCHASGNLRIEGAGVYDVVEMAVSIHHDVSQMCERRLPILVRPRDWFNATMKYAPRNPA